MTLSLCVLGCGRYAATFARHVQASNAASGLPPTTLHFASRDSARAQAYCQRYGGRGAFGSYEEAVASPEVDACYVCTPHHLHLEHASLALSHGKHVLVEKPITPTVHEGQQMIAAAAHAGLKLMVAENARFLPGVRRCKELVQHGLVGDLRLAQFHEETRFTVGGWRADQQKMGGGVFIDGGIHSVDMMVNLAGKPLEVQAVLLPQALHSLEGEDGIALTARLEGGGVAFINHGWAATRRLPDAWVALSGSRGKVTFQPGRSSITLETTTSRQTWRFSEDLAGIGTMVREFHDAILEDRPPQMPGEEGLYDLQVVLAAYRSAELGLPVKLTGNAPG